MTFWSSQKLEANKAALFPNRSPGPDIDCNAITLTVGSEYYVSPSWSDKEKTPRTVAQLKPGEGFYIPPGQFAFLQTAEPINIPRDAMGFISLKATYKLRGLVNVSGFHIDPGFEGSLIFTVFNAGPSDVHLREGMDLFLVWIASLDADSEKYRTKGVDDDRFLKTVNSASGQIKSGYDMVAKIEQLESKVQSLSVQKSVFITVAIGILLLLLRSVVSSAVGDGQPQPSMVVQQIDQPARTNQSTEVGSETDSRQPASAQVGVDAPKPETK